MKLLVLASSLLLATLASSSPAPADPIGTCPCNLLCRAGEICVTYPNSCKHICVKPVKCGGFAGIPCEEKGTICIDDPRDDCNPAKGANDCIGVCVPDKGTTA